MKKKIKTLYRGIAILLVVTLLPFASFTGIGLHKVEASPMTNNTMENPISNNTVAPQSVEDMVVAEDYLLEGDLTVRNLTMEAGVLDLNGYTLYIYENLLHTGGELHVNGGCMVVMGDYRIQSVVEESTQEDETEVEYTTSAGSLRMNTENDYLFVGGDFYTDSTVSHEKLLTNGKMEVKGDFYQYTTEAVNNFYSTGDFCLYLTGEDSQILQMSERKNANDCIANLVIENESEAGVTLLNYPHVTGTVTTNGAIVNGSLGVSNATTFGESYFDGGIYMYRSMNINNALTVGEDYVLTSQAGGMNLNQNLIIKGNLLLDGVMVLNTGNLIVEGDVTIGSTEGQNSYGFVMSQADAHILVKGDYIQNVTSPVAMSDGVLEVQGDMILHGSFSTVGNHKVLLSGSATQYVETTNGMTFHILELTNTSEEGVVLGDNIAWAKLITNGCKVTTGANSGIIGYTLEADEEIAGEFILKEDTLDLNGHTMTVTGNFIHNGGTVILNGGKLIVKGDYCKQSGSLQMDHEADHMLVCGDFYDESAEKGQIELTAGCLELKGDFYQSENTALLSVTATGQHTFLLSGEDKQVIQFNTTGEDTFAKLYHLKITNTSAEGVHLSGDFVVQGKLESERSSVIEGIARKAGSGSEMGSYYAGDVYIADTLFIEENFEIGGDLYFSGYLILYADLTVQGSILKGEAKAAGYQGNIYLNHATLHVGGNANFGDNSSDAGIYLRNTDDYALIEGDYTVENNKYAVTSSYGTMEVRGNLTFATPVIFNSGATVILSGTEKQCVSVSNGSKFAILNLANTSEEGICYHSNVFYDELIDNGCNKQYLDRASMSGYTLSQDETIEGDIVLVDGTMDLNGKTLTIKGDLIQLGGTMNINGGRLIVEGGYYLGDPDTMWEDSDGDTSVGYLNMTTADDYVLVQKDFYITWGMPYGYPSQYYNTRSQLTAGVLEVKGNFVQKEGTTTTTSAYSFPAGDDHVLLLSGDEKQTVWGRTTSASGSHIANMKITNSSDEGIVFVGQPCVLGEIDADRNCPVDGYIAIASLSQITDGYYGGSITNCSAMTITEDVEIDGDFMVAVLKRGTSVTAVGGNVKINGNMTVEGSMNATGTVFCVKGDFINNSSNLTLTKGTLEVKGDYTDNCALTYGTGHRVLLSGDKLQTIDTKATFGILELQNYSEAGVYSAEVFEKHELILNGCKLTIGDGSGQYGYMLTEDTLINGDLTLVADTLDLNGKTLTIRGDLILQNGELNINNGTLIVEGDLRIQTREPNGEGYTYTDGYGHLMMENEADTVQIHGNLIVWPGEDISKDMTTGTIILNGVQKQSVENNEEISLHNLTIDNRSEEVVDIQSNIRVTGAVEDAGRQVSGEGSIILTDINQIQNGVYGGNVILEGDSTAESDITIDGTCKVTGEVRLGNQTIRVQNLTVDGTLHTDTATLVVEEELLVEKTGLFTMVDEAYVLVKGKTTFSTSTNHTGFLTNGTLEMQGDFAQVGNKRNFWASDEHYTIFRRKNMTGPVVTQKLTAYGSNQLHFATLELTNQVENAYNMGSYYPEMLADRVIYITPGMAIPNAVSSIVPQQTTVTSVTFTYDGEWEEGSVKGFTIYRDGEKIAVTGAKTYVDTGLQPGMTYSYEVYPYNEDGNSPKESPNCVVTLPEDVEAPTVPEELMVKSRSGSAITMKWNKSKDNVAVEGYRLYRDDVLIYEGTATEYKDNDLEANTLYTYCVKAFDAYGNESEASEMVDGVVLLPQILAVTPADYEIIGGDTVDLKVTIDNTGNSGSFTVRMEYYDTEKEKWLAITTGVVTKTQTGSAKTSASKTWNIKEFSDGDVDVRITVTDCDGNMTEQIVTYTIDREAPEAPTEVMAQDEGGTVTINWKISKSADCAGYRLYRVNTGTGEGTELADITGRNSSWYSDEEIEDNTTYNYYVRAYDAFDNMSAMSNVAQVTSGTDINAPRVMGMEPASGRINRTTELIITGKDNRAVTQFKLYMRRSSEEEWTDFATIEAKDNQATYAWDTTSYEEGNYYIKVVAVDAKGNESESLFMRRYEVDNTGIAKIRLLPATAGSTTIQLEWEDVTEADFGYFVVEEKINGVWVQRAKISDKLGYRAENLQPETTHTYRVTGFDNLGNVGVPSDPVTVTTIIDTTAPYIAKVQPSGSYYKDSIPLSMTVKDNAGVTYGVFSYSLNGNAFVEIATVEGTYQTAETLNYTWDISALPEGEVIVRFEAYDTAGIHNSLYEEKEIENTYIIDRSAPSKVTGVEVVGDEGAISLQWESVSENDIASYEVERAEEGENLFKKIKTTTNTLYCTDTNVKQGKTYIYRICAVDIAGNKGEVSDEIYATVRRDEEAPVVTGISPSQEIIGSNPTLKVLAMDNARLQSILVEYREAGSEGGWYEIATINTGEKNQYQELTWNTDGLMEETVYEVRAKAVDAAGNESEYVTRSYTLDLAAPQTPELTVKTGSFCIEMEYSENTEEDFRCYKIYRRAYGEKDYTCIQATIQNEFTDAVPETDTTYYYKVRAYDIYGNYSESTVEHSYANNVDKIAPVAELPETVFGFTGMEVGFDGTMSNDNVRINRYEWDFGDGTTTTGVRPSHTYEESGTYNVTLTVRDAAGNESIGYSTVQIMDQTNTGSTIIEVVSTKGDAISGAYVYVKTGSGDGDYVQLRTDANGKVNMIHAAGIYEFSAFATGYLPNENTLRISNYEELVTTITLDEGEVVTGELTVERMSLEEMIEKGVDLSAPENYNTFTFKTQLWFASSPLPAIYDVTYNDSIVYRKGSTAGGVGKGRVTNGNGTLNVELLQKENVTQEDLDDGYVPMLTYLQTTQSVSWLKDMYDVQLGIINHANSGYTITDASATLNLPDGMSLASTLSGQTSNVKLSDIDGQESVAVSWIVKGDKTGTYDLSASFHGVLQPFEAELDAQFEAQMECEVQGGKGLYIYMYPEEAYYPGEEYYVQFKIVNQSDRIFYNMQTTLGEYKTSSSVEEVFVKDSETGELLAVSRSSGMTYQSGGMFQSVILPVLHEGDVVDMSAFKPGQTIYGTYCYGGDGVTDDETYHTLVDTLVETLEGENLGVEVVVEPVPSHVYKYILYTDYRKRLREAQENAQMADTYGDPIDITTGAFLQDLSTINLIGGSDLTFELHYNSMLADYKGEAGYGWSHDYEQVVTEAGSSLILKMSPYSETSFIHEDAMNHTVYGVLKENTIVLDNSVQPDGFYYPASTTMEGWYMEKNAQGYYLYTKEGAMYTFDTNGQMSHITTREGKGTTITHSENTMTIKDDITGDAITVHYSEGGLIQSVSDNLGRNVSIEYIDGDLTAITGVTGGRSVYRYDGCHQMVGATNANGINYVENTYDDYGRVLTQKEAGKSGVSRLAYTDMESGGTVIEICNQNGGVQTIEINAKGEKIKETASDGSTVEYIYDKYGNLLNQRDAYGNTIMYQYDDEQNVIATYDTQGNINFMEYDEEGNITEISTQSGEKSAFTYDENNRLIRNVSSLGAVTRYAYDENGNPIREIKDGLGSIAYTYEKGKMNSKKDALGNNVSCTYDIYGNLATSTDEDGNKTLYNYDASGRLLQNDLPDGTKITYVYDDIGQVIEETIISKDGDSRNISYTYDAAGNVTSMKDAAGRVTEYTYDSMSNLVETCYPDGSREVSVYDSASNLISYTNRNGICTEYTYDLLRNITSITTGGSIVKYEYYPNGKIYKITDADGQTRTYYYDNNWNCIKEKDNEGNSKSYTYDAAGNVTMEIDPLGNRITYQYDNWGRCIQTTDPNGNKTTYSYDGNDNCIRMIDALGNVTDMTYDSRNQLIEVKQYVGGQEICNKYNYDAMGRVLSMTDAEGATCYVTYDGFGNEKSIIDAEGNVVEQNSYDDLGQLIQTKDALGNTIGYKYDTMGNIEQVISCLNGENETTIAMNYDNGGRLVSVTDPMGSVVSQTYDAKGNVASLTDANGGTTTYSYDSVNRVTKIVNAIGASETYTYNTVGLLAEIEDNAGEKTTYSYDAAGRLISQKDDLGTIKYTYDKNGNVLTVSDKDGTITRTYDALNRVTSVTDYNGDTISYAYDELGNRISITYPGGEKVRYTYDKAGRMLTVTDAQGKVTYYSYDKNGRLIETMRPDGSRELCTYNIIGQLTILRDETAAGEVINEYSYEYDGNGNIINITGMDTGFSEGAQESIKALTDENPNDGITPAVQNADGTVTVAVSMTYDADNRLMTYNGQIVEYDKVGNMTRGPLNGAMADFTYDCRNRLTKVTEADGTTTEYEYDAENIRTAIIANGIRTEYITDRESTYSQTLVKTEYQKNTWGQYTELVSETTYTYGLGLIGERRDNNQEFYYHYNHIGSTMAVTDETGIIYYRYIYDTYGELSDITTDDGVSLKSSEQLTEYQLAELAHAAGIDYLYNGQYGVETDQNGLYYMRARYYDQDIKRFINRDVVSGDISNSQSLNRYCYVQGNPVSLTDPFGLCPDGNSGLIGYEKSLLWHLLQAISPSGFLNYFYSQIIAPKLHIGLDLAGILFDCSDAINGLIYFVEGNIHLGVEYTLRGLPFWGIVAIGCGAPYLGVALIIIGIGFNLAFGVEYLVDAVGTAYEDYQNGEFGLDNAAQLTLGVLSVAGGGYTATRSLRTAARGIAPSNTLGNGPQVNGKSGSTAKYYNSDGSPIWPDNRGFEGDPHVKTLQPGTLIDRYGYDSGTFVSPKGTPYTERALPLGTDKKPYTVFEVVKPVEVDAGKIAPWFGEKGGGIQYEFQQKISELIEQGILRKVG